MSCRVNPINDLHLATFVAVALIQDTGTDGRTNGCNKSENKGDNQTGHLPGSVVRCTVITYGERACVLYASLCVLFVLFEFACILHLVVAWVEAGRGERGARGSGMKPWGRPCKKSSLIDRRSEALQALNFPARRCLAIA